MKRVYQDGGYPRREVIKGNGCKCDNTEEGVCVREVCRAEVGEMGRIVKEDECRNERQAVGGRGVVIKWQKNACIAMAPSKDCQPASSCPAPCMG